VVAGLVVDGAGFEVLVGDERIGPRRMIGPADVELLKRFGRPVLRAVRAAALSMAAVVQNVAAAPPCRHCDDAERDRTSQWPNVFGRVLDRTKHDGRTMGCDRSATRLSTVYVGPDRTERPYWQR